MISEKINGRKSIFRNSIPIFRIADFLKKDPVASLRHIDMQFHSSIVPGVWTNFGHEINRATVVEIPIFPIRESRSEESDSRLEDSKTRSVRIIKMEIIPVPCRSDNYAYLVIDTATKTCAAVDPVVCSHVFLTIFLVL